MRHVVADVAIASVRDRPNEIVTLVHPVAHAKGIDFRIGDIAPQKRRARHFVRLFLAHQGKQRRHEIDEGYRRGDLAAGRHRGQVSPFLRHAHNHRDAVPLLVTVALRSWEAAAIIGIIEDDRVVGETGLFQLAQMAAHEIVHLLH